MGLRTFAALVPPADVIDHLDSFLDSRRSAEPDWRWTRPEHFHITLAFMADAREPDLDEYDDHLVLALDGISAPEVALAGAVTFPNPAEARVLAVGAKSGDDVLQRIATKARNAAVASGIEVEGDRFRPHLTVARTRGMKVEMTNWVRLLETYEGPRWVADTVHVIASHLGEGPRRSPRYETISEITF